MPEGGMTDQLIMKYDRFWNWELLSMNYDFSVDMLRMYFHRVDWPSILQRQRLPESFLREMALSFQGYWSYVVRYQKLSKSFIEDYHEKFDPSDVLEFQHLSTEEVYRIYGRPPW